jgi:hypothetical protein
MGGKLPFRATHGSMRSRHRCSKTVFVALVATAMAGCRQGEGPFLQVQFCLTKAAGADELKRVLREIARDEGMEFGDRSADTTEELRSMGNSVPPEVRQSFPIIKVGVRRGDIGVGGGNLGLGPNQVALGFSRDSPAARLFANRTVHRLQQTWRLVKVPNDRGAFPLKDCPKDA